MKLRLLAVLALAGFAVAQDNRDDLTPLEISYTTAVADDLESLRIEMVVENVQRPTTHVLMPRWSPGAYGIRNSGERVRDLEVRGNDGAKLDVTRMSPSSWSIDSAGHGTLRVSYNMPVSSRRRFGRPEPEDEEPEPVTGLRISGPSTYMYVEGAKELSVRSRYELPDGWKLANGLLPTDDPDVRFARDYDTFIDAPGIVGIFEERSFDVNGTPFLCVFFENSQEYDFDLDAFVEITRGIVTNIGSLYGSFPFPNYVFLFTIPGGGGLEHLNSTTIGLRATSQKENPEAGASVTSHEFFHTWNVKRIRPDVLGPFDYQQENYTGNLWVSEGWTSYFGDLTLARIGVWSRDEYLDHVRNVISRELNKERRKEHSVTWASRNTWHRFPDEEGSRVDYYGKGELLGLLIDLKIRHETGNRKSLNDVMRFMSRWFGEQDVGFEESDVERACTAISNYDFSEFFARHVYGTMDPPVGEILGYAGIEYVADMIPCAFPFSLRGTRISGRRTDETETQEAPRPGETLVSIDGVAFEDAHDFLRGHKPGDKVKLTLKRDEEEREVEVTLEDRPILLPSLKLRFDATEMQRRIRDSWLSSVE